MALLPGSCSVDGSSTLREGSYCAVEESILKGTEIKPPTLVLERLPFSGCKQKGSVSLEGSDPVS